VRPGDTLLSIAKEVYDDTAMSSEIFRQNTNILTSPDSLKPGMVLKLPTP
jgi:nucleoid-associated protein YgaU